MSDSPTNKTNIDRVGILCDTHTHTYARTRTYLNVSVAIGPTALVRKTLRP